jgi:hypothetical protein
MKSAHIKIAFLVLLAFLFTSSASLESSSSLAPGLRRVEGKLVISAEVA